MVMSGTLMDGNSKKHLVWATTVAGMVKEHAWSLARYATVFQTKIMALLGCAQRLEGLNTEGKDISICSNSQVALRALAAPATCLRLVGKCKEALGRVHHQELY